MTAVGRMEKEQGKAFEAEAVKSVRRLFVAGVQGRGDKSLRVGSGSRDGEKGRNSRRCGQ